jgi:hypothetical protein
MCIAAACIVACSLACGGTDARDDGGLGSSGAPGDDGADTTDGSTSTATATDLGTGADGGSTGGSSSTGVSETSGDTTSPDDGTASGSDGGDECSPGTPEASSESFYDEHVRLSCEWLRQCDSAFFDSEYGSMDACIEQTTAGYSAADFADDCVGYDAETGGSCFLLLCESISTCEPIAAGSDCDFAVLCG